MNLVVDLRIMFGKIIVRTRFVSGRMVHGMDIIGLG